MHIDRPHTRIHTVKIHTRCQETGTQNRYLHYNIPLLHIIIQYYTVYCVHIQLPVTVPTTTGNHLNVPLLSLYRRTINLTRRINITVNWLKAVVIFLNLYNVIKYLKYKRFHWLTINLLGFKYVYQGKPNKRTRQILNDTMIECKGTLNKYADWTDRGKVCC